MQKKSIIQRMENKFGKYAIKNLIIYVLLAYVVGYVLILLDSKLGIYEYLIMDPAMVMQGQVWRLFTWICSVPQTVGFWIIFMFLFYYWIGRTLEQAMGAFKYNLYMFSGWFFITLGAMVVYWITGASLDVSTYYLNLASFLAFALLFPNMQVYLFFVLPIKIKWLAFLDVAYLIYRIITYIVSLANSHQIDWSVYPGVSENAYRMMLYAQIFSIVISLLNFIIFFFMVRKITPRNLKHKFRSAQEQRTRQKNWNKNWNDARSQWKDNNWQSGQTKWNEKGGEEDPETAGRAFSGSEEEKADPWERNEHNKDLRDWADWYDPDEDQELRNQRYAEYQERKANRPGKVSRAEKRSRAKASKYGTQEYEHKCEVCGRTNVSDPDLSFRFCSKCDGNHEYCQDHIFNHEHK